MHIHRTETCHCFCLWMCECECLYRGLDVSSRKLSNLKMRAYQGPVIHDSERCECILCLDSLRKSVLDATGMQGSKLDQLRQRVGTALGTRDTGDTES